MKGSMKKIKILFFIIGMSFISFTSTACAGSNQIESSSAKSDASLYLDEDAKPRQAIKSDQVLFFFTNSKHPCARLGIIHSFGNGYASFDDCVEAAKRKAAKVGADFIVLIDSGASEEEGYGIKIRKPWANFTAWTYCDYKQGESGANSLISSQAN